MVPVLLVTGIDEAVPPKTEKVLIVPRRLTAMASMSLSKAISRLVISLCLGGCVYTVPGQNKATHDLIVEKTRSLQLDNQIKAEQLKQMRLQTDKLEAKAE